jgi:hypothetical protein
MGFSLGVVAIKSRHSNHNQVVAVVQVVASFTNTSITDYAWTFGDGGTCIDANPTHAYAVGGQYLVCLTAFNVCGASIQSCTAVTVSLVTGISEQLEQNLWVCSMNCVNPDGFESQASLNIFDVAGRNGSVQ